MRSVDFLIVGGSAAGTTAAEVIRSLKPNASITIVTDENHEQYSRVLLPYYVRGQIKREQLFLKKPEWYQDKKIELFSSTKVIFLDPKKHQIKDNQSREYQYGKLLITTGGDVVKLDVLGSDLKNILYFRTVEDADQIIETAKKSKKAVIVGGGFISLDFATGFAANNVAEVKILIRDSYYWSNKLDKSSSQIISSVLAKNGVEILTQEEVLSFQPKNDDPLTVGFVKTRSGKKLECDVVGVGIGVSSSQKWLVDAGLHNEKGIATNEYLETNLPDIYAAGDSAEFHDVIFDMRHVLGNWANATSGGRTVGMNMAVTPLRPFDNTQGSEGFTQKVHPEGQGRTIFETASSYSDNFFGVPYSFIGVTDEKFADEVISRGSVEAGKMARIFIKTIGGVMRIVGATVINDPSQVSPLTTAVKNKVDVIKYKGKLADLSFDLKNLLS